MGNLNISNILTIFRLILTPIIFILILQSQNQIALILFIIAVISDLLDGYFARKNNKTTKLGRILDPIADKFLFGSIIFATVIKYNLTFWLYSFVITAIIYIIAYIKFVKKELSVTKLGRAMIFLELFIMAALLLDYVREWLFILFIILTLIAAFDYLNQAYKK